MRLLNLIKKISEPIKGKRSINTSNKTKKDNFKIYT